MRARPVQSSSRTWRDEQGRPRVMRATSEVESRLRDLATGSDRVRELSPRPRPQPPAAQGQRLRQVAVAQPREGSPQPSRVSDRGVGMPCRRRSCSCRLHVQPESSVDVMGRRWRDQAYTASVLADALDGAGHRACRQGARALHVATRPRLLATVRRCTRTSPTIDPFADSRELAGSRVHRDRYRHGRTGGALLGLPAVTGAKMPWAHLGNVAHIPQPDDLPRFVASERGWDSLREYQGRIDEWFVDQYVAQSWEGLVLDPPRVPAVLEPREHPQDRGCLCRRRRPAPNRRGGAMSTGPG